MSSTARTLFGTDGIRGKAGVYPLIPETILKLGQAAADVLLEKRDSREWPCVVIGKDTRQSGDMLEAAIAAGLNSRGVDVRLAGVIPTPAIAQLTVETGAAFGIVISASHNPFGDNGIKFFGHDGYKLGDEVELAIEQALLSEEDEPRPIDQIGRTGPLENATERYVHFVCATLHNDSELLKGMKIALDSANGAAFQSSEAVLKHLGAEVIPFHDQPNGLNINNECGCTHAEIIEALVKETGADVGVSHDGDADRVLLCDENASCLDGDEIMAIAGIDMIEQGELVKNTVVATVMSNAGLGEALSNAGGTLLRAGVGDRYVMEEMKKGGYNLGGEQSGHLIFRDSNTTGDGIVAAVQLLRIMKRRGQPLSELRKLMTKFPQAQRNVRVTEKKAMDDMKEVSSIIEATETELGTGGRVLIRYSGTEPLLRILIEGKDEAYIEAQADAIASAVKIEIGEA